MQNQQTAKNFKKELKVTIVLLCIVLLFLTLEAPVNIAYVFTHLSMTTRITFTITFIVNHTINFFTYIASNDDFRAAAWEKLKGGAKEGDEKSASTRLTRGSSSKGSGKLRAVVAENMAASQETKGKGMGAEVQRADPGGDKSKGDDDKSEKATVENEQACNN